MADRSAGLPVVTAAGALFCVALMFLALQMRAGDDPAIGAGPKAESSPAARPMIVRRVIVRRIVEASPGASAPAPPAAAAPEPAGPAPAPAAAPVTTQAS